MDKKYYIEIVPLEKGKDILNSFADHNPKVFSKQDAGYDWLEEDDSICIVFENPYGGSPLEINIGDSERFTLFFSERHAHYEAYQEDYEDMLTRISDIFSKSFFSLFNLTSIHLVRPLIAFYGENGSDLYRQPAQRVAFPELFTVNAGAFFEPRKGFLRFLFVIVGAPAADAFACSVPVANEAADVLGRIA